MTKVPKLSSRIHLIILFHCLNCCCKIPKCSDTYSLYSKCSNIQTKKFYHGLIPQNDAIVIANSVDPDQTAPLGLQCLQKTSLSKNLGSLRYSSGRGVCQSQL